MDNFTNTELSILKLFYKGMPASELEQRHERDPLPIVARHRALPADEFDAVKQQIATLRCTNMGLAPPDDPIFSGRIETFSVRRRRHDMTELDEQIKWGMRGQSEGLTGRYAVGPQDADEEERDDG
jgi:hypothetical protein